MYAHLFQNFNDKPWAKRLKLWRFRKELGQKLVAEMILRSAPSASSGETAATSLPVIKQETERKRKFEEPPFVNTSAQLHDKKKPVFCYIELHNGSPPLMSPLHVTFAAKSVDRLRKRPTLTGPESTELWKQDDENGLITVEIARPGRGHRASGKACHFFDNGYFKMNELHIMTRGEVPLPLCSRIL